MISMDAQTLKNIFTEDLCFSDYVSKGFYPPLPPDDNNTQSIYGQQLEEADKGSILLFIDANLEKYIKYILSLYEDEVLGKRAVNRFLRTNSTYVPENINNQYQPNAVLNNVMQSIVDECMEHKDPFILSQKPSRKSSVQTAEAEPESGKESKNKSKMTT